MDFEFDATLWLYSGEGAWVFVTLPVDTSQAIKEISGPIKKGFGSVRVTVTVNGVSWQTSLFPDSKLAAYVLPIKKDVRQKAGVAVGDTAKFTIKLSGI